MIRPRAEPRIVTEVERAHRCTQRHADPGRTRHPDGRAAAPLLAAIGGAGELDDSNPIKPVRLMGEDACSIATGAAVTA